MTFICALFTVSYSYIRAHISSVKCRGLTPFFGEVVRSGAISREQGFRELELHGIVDTPPEDTIAYYTETVGMSRAEFDKLLKRRRVPLTFWLSQVIEHIRWFFK